MADEKFELNNQQLDETAGGRRQLSTAGACDIYNSKHQKVGTWQGEGTPVRFVPCDKCGRPMHKGSFGWYCDPCNRHLWSIDYYDWKGTIEELKAASL